MSVAYPAAALLGLFLVCWPLDPRAAIEPPLSYRGFISRRALPNQYGVEPASRQLFICLLRGSSLARQTLSVIAISVMRAFLLTSPIHQIPVFLFVPLSPPLACPALTRSPARCSSCALRD